eukprot:Seg1245.3 transcript_id=Seg1245.3/GoldUCD/mRNA.D3Y31 product="Armadillo repeat-containing protein 10" protein_id=Seg1245.3/GoldUCD/D3Y31
MAPALSKLRPIFVGISVALFGVISVLSYKYFKEKEEDESEDNELTAKSSEETVVEDRLQELMLDLDHTNEKIVLCALCSLGNLTAFKEFQILVREYGGLTKIPELLEVTSLDVRIQALNVINNLAMDAENQAVLRSFIPSFVTQLHRATTNGLYLAATRVLTNFSTLDENHSLIVPHLSVLFELLHTSDSSVKLQILKILVNLSTNAQVTENQLETDAQMIRAIEGFIDFSVEYEILLRAVTCLANILSALNRRWHNRSRSLVSTAEFVPEDMQRKLEELLEHHNQEIVYYARTSLQALEPAVAREGSDSLTSIELIEALQL